MAKKPILSDVVNILTSAPVINANSDRIEEAFDNTLSLDGSTPNAMQADLDLNSNDILNVNRLQVQSLEVDGANLQELADQVAEDAVASAASAAAAEASETAAAASALEADLALSDKWKGAWLTATVYAKGDLVRSSGSTYICVIAHTSGVFATDLTAVRWELFAQQGAAGAGTGDMIGANNLSDVASPATARANIGAQEAATALTQISALTDPNEDALISWDDTAGAVAYTRVGVGINVERSTGSPRIASSPAKFALNDFVGENTTGLLADLKVTAAQSARFAGAYRSRNIGAINWYFAAQAMTLAPEVFTKAERQTFCQVAIDKGVVSPRQNSAAYTANTFVTFPSGKVFFCNIAGSSAVSAPSDAAIITAGSFLGDGTVTWEYTGFQVPASWQWFLVDIASNLLTVQAPDSTDAYAAMLASAIEMADVTNTWLNTASAHPGNTRIQVINNLIQHCMTDDLTGSSPGARLSYVFQNQLTPAGAANTVRYLADNVEVWRGYVAQVTLLGNLGLSTTAAAQNAADVKAGILSTQLFASGRFKAYVGRPDWDTIGPDDALYVTDFRFHLYPSLYGMLSTLAERQTYGDAVFLYIKGAVPGLFTASLDTFPLVEGFIALTQMGLDIARQTALSRIGSRTIGNIVITDAALIANLLGLTKKQIANAVVGTRVALSDQSFTNVPQVDFTQLNNPIYKWYEFEIEQALPLTNAVALYMRFSSNGGVSYDATAGNYYQNAYYMEATAGPANDGGSLTAAILSSNGRAISNVGLGARGRVHLRNAGNSAMYTEAESVVSHEGSGGNYVTCWAKTKRVLAQDTDAVRFLMSSGNMTGRIIMYGIVG